MPKALERKLKAAARRHHFGKRRTAAYVYGTIARSKTGWKPAKRKRSRRR